MRRVSWELALPLFSQAQTQAIEHTAQSHKPEPSLMQRAGESVARLALALAPHAQTIWIVCGHGNNGGDGLAAATYLHQHHRQVHVTWLGTPERASADTHAAWLSAQQAGVRLHHDTQAPVLCAQDLIIDALLGLGLQPRVNTQADPTSACESTSSSSSVPLLELIESINHQHRTQHCTVLAVDLPSGLHADTGHAVLPQGLHIHAQHTLSLLTLKPGLLTHLGRDATGTLWWDDLGVDVSTSPACAWSNAPSVHTSHAHASHKGSFGDVLVLGGAAHHTTGESMAGAALLCARAALYTGAGRVMVHLLAEHAPWIDFGQLGLMQRHIHHVDLKKTIVVCGCGGGSEVAAWLPHVLEHSQRLVLDADALNAIARSSDLQQQVRQRALRGQLTVLTPHPLEAARLLASSETPSLHAQDIQADRLSAAQALSQKYAATVVLKGSGTIIVPGMGECVPPGSVPLPWINPTGNARLATAGTGDVLAGMIGSRLAQGENAVDSARHAVYHHGWVAQNWSASTPFSAHELARWVGQANL